MNKADALDAIIITGELDRRPARAPDYLAESRALVALMKSLKAPNANVLQELAEAALRLCHAGSAGITLIEDEGGDEVFRWRAAAGKWSAYLGHTMPRGASPSGIVVDWNTAVLMQHPER